MSMNGSNGKWRNCDCMKVDVHIITLPSTDKGMWRFCEESLFKEPINIHMVDGVIGNIAEGRVKGFSQGSSPYVSFVDPDDMIIPGAFEACIKTLEKHHEAVGVYTDELIMDAHGITRCPGQYSRFSWSPVMMKHPIYVHHLLVMRRSIVEKYFDAMLRHPKIPEYVLRGMMIEHGPWVHVDRYGYKWRKTKGTLRSTLSDDELKSAYDEFRPFITSKLALKGDWSESIKNELSALEAKEGN